MSWLATAHRVDVDAHSTYPLTVAQCKKILFKNARTANVMLIPEANLMSRPMSFLLIHFKSGDTRKLFKQGNFWHLFILKNGEFGGAVISQDAKEVCNEAVESKTTLGELLLQRGRPPTYAQARSSPYIMRFLQEPIFPHSRPRRRYTHY